MKRMQEQRARAMIYELVLVSMLITANGCVPSETSPRVKQESTDDELVAYGRFETTQAGADLGYQIQGDIDVFTGWDDSTVNVEVEGLKPEYSTYPAHVHNGACAEGGGGHYMMDPNAEAGAENEIWPTVQAFDGNGFSSVTVWHVIRPDARSIVIHDPETKAKIACADIRVHYAQGSLSALPAGVEAGLWIDGWAAMYSRDGVTYTWVQVYGGLDPFTTYPAHVHNAPCAEGGGTHYLLDPAAESGEANEIWPTIETDEAGHACTQVVTWSETRLDAQSVVIHDPVTKAKIACADLD